jgi:hypothetical protein
MLQFSHVQLLLVQYSPAMKTSIWTETMTQNIHAPNRRRFVRSAVASSLLMPGILSEILAADSAEQSNPLAPKQPHFPAKAKSVIFLFMSGGVSHIDSFDPKPKLIEDHGKEVVFDHPETRNRPGYENILEAT